MEGVPGEYVESGFPLLLEYAADLPPAQRCEKCRGAGYVRVSGYRPDNIVHFCEPCASVGYFGIDPSVPTILKPGPSQHSCKSAVVAARVRAGFPLWIDGDAIDDETEVYLGTDFQYA